MSYKYATIKLEFNISTFEQYTPSSINFYFDFEYGADGNHKLLSNYDRLRFLRMARDSINNKIEEEIMLQVKSLNAERMENGK